jgi:ATP-dependent Lon protease
MNENEKNNLNGTTEAPQGASVSIPKTETDDNLAKPASEDFIPMIPLRGITIFPSMVLHFDIGREKSIAALEKAMLVNQTVFLASQINADTELPTPADFYHTGTIAKIKQMLRLPGNNVRVLVEGQARGVIEEIIAEVPYFKCRVRTIPEQEPPKSAEMEAAKRTVLATFKTYLENSPNLSTEIYATVESIPEAGRLCDIIAGHLPLKTEDKQKVLEAFTVPSRLVAVSEILSRENEILLIEKNISSKVKEQMDKNQKEYYLNEQIKAIRQELGEDEDAHTEADKWLKQLADLPLPEAAREKAEKEIKRYARMPMSSPDATVLRSYIEWIFDLPWGKRSEDNLDVSRAEAILNEDHYGLEKVKERVLEYLSVMKLSNGMKAPILCLVGPPGTGKTSIAKSIARALGRKFVRMSLGGVRDEAEIRGHRRTYIGAIPGRIISGIREAGTENPVFLFDEVDKIGTDFRGDPASALLEVLDPEQNATFTDHYLEMPFDLSKVMFLTTANTTETIPRPLLDRMEVIEISGYTDEEKIHIADQYLVPKQMKENGLSEGQVSFADGAILSIITHYTRESGVRNLERQIGSVCRKAARKIVQDGVETVEVKPENVEEILGKMKYLDDDASKKDQVGVVNGMAWTSVGGTTLTVEAAVLPGSGQIVLTGQLGDVMQESARAGISYIRSRAKQWKIDEDFYKEKDIHIHIPEGATPKDGPSAGVTMCVSVISALTGRPVRKDVAMTGEITLRGQVLPVGGIKEKMLAAHRMGIKKVLLPEENKPDLDDLPQAVRDEMEFVLLKKIDDAVREAIE